MIIISDKTQCCGCNACVQRCPKHCISMNEDKEGFLYPKVDTTICINCGLCNKVCPVINQIEPKRPLQVFAAKNNNDTDRLQSSSGGLFILLAKKIINAGGVVFGARFDSNWEVVHSYVEDWADIWPLMQSKYVQSRIGNSFIDVEQFLKQGRKVLFVGTSCQVSALRLFLHKDYDNLLLVDLICHGVPSPAVWRKYLNETVQSMASVKSINFREKQLGGFTWEKYGVRILGESVIEVSPASENPYIIAFLNELISRPSCFFCPAKDGKSKSDLTIADFWGVDNVLPKFNDHKGTGMLIVHTDKGKDAIIDIDAEMHNCSYDVICKYNKSYVESAKEKRPERKKFWHEIENGQSVAEACRIALKKTIIERVILKIYRTLKMFIR